MTNQEQVREFYRAKNAVPGWPVFRMGLLIEEMDELRIALRGGSDEELAKEMADVMYTMYGLADSMGIDLDRAFEIVHESNMTKPRADYGGGKVQKGRGYTAPDLSSAVRGGSSG